MAGHDEGSIEGDDLIASLRARAEKAEARIKELRDGNIGDHGQWLKDQAEIARLREALGFFMCCVKSGEPWTDACEEMRRAALSNSGER